MAAAIAVGLSLIQPGGSPAAVAGPGESDRPPVPTDLGVDGAECGTSAEPAWVRSVSPTFRASPRSADGPAQAQFRVRQGDVQVDKYTSDAVPSGTSVSWTTAETLSEADEGAYRFYSRSYDGLTYSKWSEACWFQVDSVPPELPQIERVDTGDDLDEERPVTLRLTSTDANGIAGFEYGIDREVREHELDATDDSAEITFTGLDPGRHIAYVWALDPAGNVSERASFSFFVSSIPRAPSAAAWRLDGDLLDDSGEGHDLSVGDGVSQATDRNGRPDAALRFTGAGGACASTDDAVLNTRGAYSVAGWARVDPNGEGTYATAVSQSGSQSPGFALRYVRADSKWEMAVASADVAEPEWYRVTAAETTPSGEWTHIAASVDPARDVLRLYVNGALSATASAGDLADAKGPMLVGCTGTTTSTSDEFTGDLDHIGAWDGLLTRQKVQRAMTELPAATVGSWELAGSGADASGFNGDLTPEGGYTWGEGPFGHEAGALTLDGADGSCATASGPVLRTDESFTIAAWAKLSNAGNGAVVAAQGGESTSAFSLGWDEQGGRWTMDMPSADSADATTARAQSQDSMDPTAWTHLVGVYDAATGQVTLHVNGEEHSAVAVDEVWHGAGAFHLGCGTTEGELGGWTAGSIARGAAFRGAVSDDQVQILFTNPPAEVIGMWPLDGPGSFTQDPAELRDYTDAGNDLSIPGDYGWADDRVWLPEGALSLQSSPGSCAETEGPVVETDASFTVAAWVQAGELTRDRVLLSQAASQGPGFTVGYDHAAGRWEMTMPSADDPAAEVRSVRSTSGPDPDPEEWTHLAARYDVVAGEIELFVDGESQGAAAGPAHPWLADGPLLVGCVNAADGDRGDYWASSVDQVRAWSSLVSDAEIRAIARA